MLPHDVRSKLVGPLAPGVHAACDGHIFRFVLQWNHTAYLPSMYLSLPSMCNRAFYSVSQGLIFFMALS
jgi:hypothetical protein